MGESSGGCLAAATALMARDASIHLVHQLLIYPMLDDRTKIADQGIVPFLTWTNQDNVTGWRAFLGDFYGKETLPKYASPARCRDLKGAAPAYIEAVELDLFRNEDIAFGLDSLKAEVSVEMRLILGGSAFF